MRVSVLKRLLIALLAIAFVDANLPASCIGASAMDTAAMMAPMDHPCSDCLGSAPTTELAKMGCGALACAGIVGLLAPPITVTPDVGKFLRPPNSADELAGISLKPDPFPPRPMARA